MNARPTSVPENLLDDKELPCLQSENKKSENVASSSPTDSKLSFIVSSEKNCSEFDSERESEAIYAPVESYASQNTFYADPGDLNWPYDLSRNRARSETLDYSLQYQNSDVNYRNPYNSFAGAMKGNLMALSHFNDFISPPSSVSPGYELSDDNNNSNSFINIEQAYYQSAIDEVIREELKLENRFSVEDGSGSYTTLTNATPAAPLDMYHIHDYQRNYAHNHSTSSGGDSRSPDYNEDYENGAQFTQLTNLTSRTNGIYSPSPNAVGDHNILTYDNSHVLSPTR